MLFINRWFLSLLVALVVLDGGVQAFRYYKRMGNRFRPVIMKPMPVGRFGFVRAENPNADGAMDAKSGEESSDVAPQAPAMDGLPMHDMHEPQMREMIHDSPHPVEIDMGPEMQSRVMGFEGELDEGNFGRAAGDEGEDKEEEEGGQFRHFKHKKHKKHKYVIHTHHHYHHKKGGEGYGHHGYGHGHHGGYGHGHHGGYGGHHHGGGGHGYGHGDEGDEGDDYEPTYGHHGRYRRSSSMSESSPAQELASDGGPQALDRTVLHSSPDHPIPLVAVATTDPGTPGSPAYRQSVSRRQLVRSKNERLARIGRDRAQRANRLRSMAKRMIEGLEGGGRSGRVAGEDESGAAGEGSVPQRWAHRRRTKSEWRRRDANAGRRRRPMPVEKVIERRTPEEVPLPVTPPPVITVDPVESVVEEREVEREQEDEPGCDDPICSNFYVDERKLTTTSTTPREPEHRLEEELEPKLVPLGNEIDEEEGEEAPVGTFVAQPREEPKSTRNSLWRGLSKRLSAFRERQADRVARRRMIIAPEQSSTTTADPMSMDDDEYDSNEIVEYYQQQDVGRVLYRMANGRLLEEPQRLHLRRSAEGADEEGDSNSLRKRRLNRLSNRMNRRRKPTKSNAASEAQPAEGASDKSRTPMINIGTFRLTDPKYDGAGSAPVPAATGGVENTGAARSVSGTVPADMDNYIMQKVREYCSTSCAAGKAQPPPVIIMPSAPVVPVSNSEPIVGSSRQLIVQPASTYEDATVAPATARTSAPNPPASCPTKIVKCIPKALADRSGSKRYRKTESSPQPSSDDPAEDKESNPLVSLARGMRHYRFNPFRRLFGPFARL
ncbi:uncharacterized protein LOC118502981 isoform X2 [Anopheles stephensi]|uniref:uncharacterized protein LOC118502981 isoform X2 n=1 Tax=Anopheles stephensi TaxID=30069 RepID=UPI001658956B|nr:uncharacterized protein LOC118502981 isoform X2 [Anopheles stephensi]